MVVTFVAFCSLISSINSQRLVRETLCDQKNIFVIHYWKRVIFDFLFGITKRHAKDTLKCSYKLSLRCILCQLRVLRQAEMVRKLIKLVNMHSLQ